MDLALLLLRITVGLIVAGHGSQKLFGSFGGYGLKATAGHLHGQGFRPAIFWAFLGGASEFAGGLLFALGFLSPLGAIGVAVAMAIAVTKLHWPKFWATEGGYEYALVNLVVALAVGIAGPGAFSLDALWGTGLPPAVAQVVIVLAAIGYLVGMIHSAAKPTTAAPKAEQTRPV